jgi:hypothetical protein
MVDCLRRDFSAHGRGIQITAELGIDPASYLNEQYQHRGARSLRMSELREGRKPQKLSLKRQWCLRMLAVSHDYARPQRA